MMDYKRFAITLLCVGSFFYLGAIIPSEGKMMFNTYGYLIASILFLTASIVCFYQSSKCKKNLVDIDEKDSQ